MFKVFPRSFSSSNTNISFTYLMRSERVTEQNSLADGIVNNSQLFVWHDYAASSASWEKVNVKGIFNPTAEHYQELVFNIFMPGWKGRVTWVIWLHLLCLETIWQYNEEGQVKTRLHSPGKKKKSLKSGPGVQRAILSLLTSGQNDFMSSLNLFYFPFL